MTVQLHLPKDLEERLLAEVRSGRHHSVEDAILEKLSRADDMDLLAATGFNPAEVRRDLDNAWNNRQDLVDGNAVFDRIAAKSASRRSQDK